MIRTSIGFVIAKTLGDSGSIKAEKRVSEAQVAISGYVAITKVHWKKQLRKHKKL